MNCHLLPSACGRFHFLLGLLCLWLAVAPTRAADSPLGDAAFKAAASAFEDRNYDWAERALDGFLSKFPDSPRRAEAVLRQAQCRFELKKYAAVADLLTARMASAGELADRYRYLLAEAQFKNGDHAGAASTYASLVREFPQSPLRLRASYGEADARFKLNDFKRVEELLKNPAGPFQQAALGQTNDLDVVRGYLLLGDAYFEQKNYDAAERAMTDLARHALTPELDWRRQFLIASSQLANRRSEDALRRVTNLVALAVAATNPVLQATSLMFQGAILETTQPEAAIKTYEAIVSLKGIPSGQSRQAVLKTVALEVSQNRLTNAIARLAGFAAQSPQDPDLDLAFLTLGELHLKQFHALADPVPLTGLRAEPAWATNALRRARAQFDLIINTFTNSSWVGKAWLNRGWCLWEEARLGDVPARFGECQKAFQTAAERLPISDDQALAWFKVADCLFEQRDYANAVKGYEALFERFARVAFVKKDRFDQALYQMVRALLELDRFPEAKKAWEKLCADFPNSALLDDALLTLSQTLLNHNHALEARESLRQFEKRFTESPLLPEARLLMTRTYVQELNWPEALRGLDQWVARYSNQVLSAQAEFERAWVNYRADKETNAFVLYTNFVARFPADPKVPWAQLWVADYFYRQGGADYKEAEKYYQTLFQSTNAAMGDLRYHAWLMAAKSAFLRQKPTDARFYLTNLLAERNCPAGILPEAYFLLGEVSIADLPPPGSTNNLDRFLNAIVAFSYVTNYAAAGRLGPLARGRIADCHFQFATQDPKRYAEATNEWHRVLESAAAGVSARSQAAYGLAKVYERQAELRLNNDPQAAGERKALLEAAWDRYRDIIYGHGVLELRLGERLDPFWVKEAGLALGPLAIRLQKTGDAVGLYQRLAVELPALRETWEKKIGELNQETPK